MNQRTLFGASVFMMVVPWLWPFLLGPLPAMLPDLLFWMVGAALIFLLPLLRDRIAEACAWAWLISALLNTVIALLQYFDLENAIAPWVVYAEPGIAFGNIQQANLFATLLSIGLISLLFLAQIQRVKQWPACWMGVLLLAGHAVAASRTGFVELVLIVVLLLYWRPLPVRQMLFWIGSGAFILLALGWAFPHFLQLFSGVDAQRQLLQRVVAETSCQSRLVIWSNVIELISARPWTGWGWDGLLYAHYAQPMQGERACIKLSNAHNIFLQLAVEYGLPFALSVFVALAGATWYLKPWRAQKAVERLGWSVLAMIGFHSLVEFPLWFGHFQLTAALAIALVFRARTVASDAQAAPALSRLRVVVASLSLMVLTFIAVDYHRVSQIYLPEQWRSRWYEPNTMLVAQRSVLFKSHALVAQVVMLPVTADNAVLMLEAAQQLLPIAPDARIIGKLLQAAEILGREDLMALHSERFKVAWPNEFQEWQALNRHSMSKK